MIMMDNFVLHHETGLLWHGIYSFIVDFGGSRSSCSAVVCWMAGRGLYLSFADQISAPYVITELAGL